MPKAKTARTKNRIYLRGEKIWLYEEMEVKKKKKKTGTFWNVIHQKMVRAPMAHACNKLSTQEAEIRRISVPPRWNNFAQTPSMSKIPDTKNGLPKWLKW
jgi:hypothetical protein